MKMICTAVGAVMGTVFLAGVSYGVANESKKEGPPDNNGVTGTGIWYKLTGLILAYGVCDSSFKKS